MAGLILVVFSDVHASDRASKNMLHFFYIWNCTVTVIIWLFVSQLFFLVFVALVTHT